MDRFGDRRPFDIPAATREDADLLRALARRNPVRGTARAALARAERRRLDAALARARRLRRVDQVEDEALSRLEGQGGLIEALAREAGEGGARLPAWRGRARIEAALEALVQGGDAPLSRERLLACLDELDAAQPLTVAELWAAPRALRVVLARALARLSGRIVGRCGRYAAAERWARNPRGPLPPSDAAFLARALRCAGEEGLPRARRRLDAHLARRGLSEAAVVARAQAAGARELLRLENLMAARRMLDGLDWQRCFAALSRTEQELMSDPAGVYPRMDDASRAAVRDETARIARRLGLSEPAVARCAADAARSESGLRGNVCWWLYDDEGRRALLRRMGRGKARLPRIVPDPSGRRTVAALAALIALLSALFALAADCAALWPACLVLGWCCADAVAGRLFPLRFRPARLLKLELKAIPDDCRVLVTVPVLLSSPERVEVVCDQLEALGCGEPDDNAAFLLLGDLADADAPKLSSDGAILARARERVSAMNARAGRERFALLCRPRTLLRPDDIWMGRDRKRGALEDLNRLLAGEPGAEAAFAAEGAACPNLAGRFAYVITLDADTRLLPGDARRLVGAMAHPLNRPGEGRGYALLQPRMEPLPSACVNRFVKLFAGAGGVNAYPVAVSSLWQDVTGAGIYAGKGIYDVRAFRDRLAGALPEGRVLSHDLIEGAAAGAGFVGDVALYDGHPATAGATLSRLHRWIRGDWQLLPILCRGRLLNGRPLALADRFRMLDNLIRSLRGPGLLALLIFALWTGRETALLAALAAAFAEPLLRPGARLWRRALAELALLPALAWNAGDAVARTLWRLGVSGKRLMQWVTAADAEAKGGMNPALPGRAAALLLVPGLLAAATAPAALALGLLFAVGPVWVRDMERDALGEAPALTARERDSFLQLARETWRFFEDNVPLTGPGLPPDNVQLDPPVGAARRTSPTNAALYLMSCLAASRLGFIGGDEARARVGAALDDLEKMEKWRGHLYNWYDIDTLRPLWPRYVSAVDSGNLAAALLLCGNAKELGAALRDRSAALARGIDLAALYDADRELFFIGLDAANGRMSQSHYDLLASESRILSFAAMMLGQVPPRHWQRLGRPCARTEGGVAPLSWSGTLFEYLMPELLMPAPANTLLGEGVRAATRTQIARGMRLNRPWGVSESGFCALDEGMNYQYRAFGLRALALDGEAVEGVVAPYATALAAMVEPAAAARNIDSMRRLGWAGKWGLYEAADYLRPGGDGAPALVRSHMAHHQGMALCALCNALTGNSLARDFMGLPEARALAPLLEERAPGNAPARLPRRRQSPLSPQPRLSRRPGPGALAPETHLLAGGGASALCTDDGAIHYRRGDFWATRFSGALQGRNDLARLHLTDLDTGARATLGGGASFEPGAARFSGRLGRVEARETAFLSPEDGTLVRAVTLKNAGERPAWVAVTDVVPVALAREADWLAHAAFQCLFVECRAVGGDALLFRRRPGSRGEDAPRLIHLAAGDGEVSWETDYEKLTGRAGDAARGEGLSGALSNAVGAPLNPASALRMALTLAPGQEKAIWFAMNLLEGDASEVEWRGRWREAGRVRRAMELAGVRARATLSFVGIGPNRHDLLQRMAALLADGTLSAQARGARRGQPGAGREALWALGLSGDRPILAMSLGETEDGRNLRELVRAHEFYRAMGVETDLALVDDGEGGYARPVRDMIEAQIASSHLNCLRGAPGGVWRIDGGTLAEARRRALVRHAAAYFTGGRDFYAQARGLLAALEGEPRRPAKALDAGRSALQAPQRLADNGFGGFVEGGYAIGVRPDRLPPAPWCNILAGDGVGLLLSERGGGFVWQGSSREGRLTPYGNDPLREGWGLMLYLADGEGGRWLRLLPGERPQTAFEARFDADSAAYRFENERLAGEVRFTLAADRPEVRADVALENRGLEGEDWAVWGFVDWLLGAGGRDAAALNAWGEGGFCLATGAAEGAGYFASSEALAQPGPGRCAFLGRGDICAPEGFDGRPGGEGWTLRAPVALPVGGAVRLRFALGWAADVAAARERARGLRLATLDEGAREPRGLVVETPDPALNRLANDFLIHQVRASRVLGRTGLCQPGGAWGFRDQLQDMLALLHSEPGRVREHLLRCAGRQFEAGDALHWWHAPRRGVRTRVSDDVLFLPWVTAEYVRVTGDSGVLDEVIPFLADVEIPEGREDVYREMEQSDAAATLHDHCMRAFRHVDRRGGHGLLLMGAGDWNDGMNRVGAKGAGESVWLTEFAAACAESYRQVAPAEEDRLWLRWLAQQLRGAVEEAGWDGGWYLRAYDDDGVPLGGAANGECRVDAISQAWAVLAGLDAARCDRALDAAWEQLVDEETGIIRLLTPPFEGVEGDPGYIRGYPPGVRENGGQYTHGALWLLLALIRRGDAARAHRALDMLLPYRHSDTEEKALVYRVEPYVMAGDVYDLAGKRGRGGWTWYTGAAGWMYGCLLALLGYERRGNRVRLAALLGDWERAGVSVPFGGSVYRLICDKKAVRTTLDGVEIEGDWIDMTDDGRAHEAVFPRRKELPEREETRPQTPQMRVGPYRSTL